MQFAYSTIPHTTNLQVSTYLLYSLYRTPIHSGNFVLSTEQKNFKNNLMANTKWTLDPTHSELGFKIKHLMITNVSGSFKSFNIEMDTKGEDLTTAQVRLTADMTSITTNNEGRDAHLRNGDFFDTDNHPQLEFKSTSVESDGGNDFIVNGDLTLKGISKPVRLNIEYSGVTKDPWGGERAGFVVTGKIKRSEWGINFNSVLETGGVALSDEVKINAEVQLVKHPAEVTA